MGVPVIGSELISGSNVHFGVELDSAIRDPHKHIGFAGVIYEPKRPSSYTPVDRLILIYFDNSNQPASLGSSTRFPRGNPFSYKLTQLRSRANGRIGEQSLSRDRTLPNH